MCCKQVHCKIMASSLYFSHYVIISPIPFSSHISVKSLLWNILYISLFLHSIDGVRQWNWVLAAARTCRISWKMFYMPQIGANMIYSLRGLSSFKNQTHAKLKLTKALNWGNIYIFCQHISSCWAKILWTHKSDSKAFHTKRVYQVK